MAEQSDWAGARGERWAAQLSGMESMLMQIDEPLIVALRLEAPCRIAELGCGGGGTAMELVRRAQPGSVVHGFDISPKLIELARGRSPHGSSLAFEVADIATAAPEKPYDRLVSRFGLMFFDDPRAAFTNLGRWLETGGRFAFAVWGPASDNAWITAARDVTARFVTVPTPEPDAPGPFRYANEGKLLELLGDAGFSDLEVRDWQGALPIGGHLPPATAADFALSQFSGFGELLAKAGDDALETARQSLTTIYSDHQRDGAVWMDACVRIVTGLRPKC